MKILGDVWDEWDGTEIDRKEKLCTLTAPLVESKDEGQLNYTVKLIVLIVASS